MEEFLTFISGGIIGGFVGAFLGGSAKFFWEYYLPGVLTWQRQKKIDREKFLSQFRDPAMRATTELQDRIYALLKTGHIEYLRNIGREDYSIISNAFLIAQFFTWVEILRRKASSLDYVELMTIIETVGNQFSQGRSGFQIFHLEQREIGERLIIRSSEQGDNLDCIGYSDFMNLINGENPPLCFTNLLTQVREELLVEDLPVDRLVRIQHALVDVMDFIDPNAKWVPKGKRTKVCLDEPII